MMLDIGSRAKHASMMLARVADSLYWMGRYIERAEHMCAAIGA
jgi:hypothetical protein